MADSTSARILTWNAANWITVVLMVGLGFAIVGFSVRLYQQKKSKTAAVAA